jgi:tRNA U55 pseudouridine synthase TruB
MEFNEESFIDGNLLLINKPLKWTSFQVVNKIRWLIKKQYGIKKIKGRSRWHIRSSCGGTINSLYR